LYQCFEEADLAVNNRKMMGSSESSGNTAPTFAIIPPDDTAAQQPQTQTNTHSDKAKQVLSKVTENTQKAMENTQKAMEQTTKALTSWIPSGLKAMTQAKYTLPDKTVASQVLMYRQLLHTKCRPGLRLSRPYQATPAQKCVLHMPVRFCFR
jgi:hypothetical protein